MAKAKTYIAKNKVKISNPEIEGSFVSQDGERFFKVENYDSMPPFLMSIVSDSDHWMFVSSSGGLTAGRKNPDQAIFPYYTDDKIHESSELAGNKSILRVKKKKRIYVWEPFSDYYKGIYKSSKNLYKSSVGNQVIFEEINHDLEIVFRIKWMNSDKYGWIRETSIKNISKNELSISLLDGIRNILPSGILKSVQEQYSTLMDAYKKSELEETSQLGIFSMSSIPVDRAEPSEALKATTVWNTCDDVKNILLSSEQLESFRTSGKVVSENEKRGVRGAYYIVQDIKINKSKTHTHLIVADLNKDTADVLNLIEYINGTKKHKKRIYEDVNAGSINLKAMVKDADGVQDCGDERVVTRHFSNVLFNIMRGGIYENEYTIKKQDLENHFQKFNKHLFKKHADWISNLEEEENYLSLIEKANQSKDADLQRIVLEYLPLTFSRRHGDPSRPWNRFSIDIKNPDGSRSLSYEGNWRDIFQNWEALSYSYPSFLEGIITKFLNASTADGYNPYRITNEGVDWETFDPSDPWSFIGYWGDHQIIYLQKLLELHEKFFPEKLNSLLDKNIYTFANVPYRLKTYEEIVQNPNNTIVFNEELHAELLKKAESLGADGKLLTNLSGKIVHANLLEKLLIPLLTKLSNLIPGAGIWLNTQRPEWNDANNALVGNGVSMVTLYYLRRHLQFITKLLKTSTKSKISVSSGLVQFLDNINESFSNSERFLKSTITNKRCRLITDELGEAGSRYRSKIYDKAGNKKATLEIDKLVSFLSLSLKYINHSIAVNKREDKLYHAYNLIELERDSITIQHLPLMLEGQVAFLSSGYAEVDEVLEILKALRGSKLYRKDQDSYILYPNKKVPLFTEKNTLGKELHLSYPIISKILQSGSTAILVQDESGRIHFNGDLKNAAILEDRIQSLNNTEQLQIGKKDSKDLLEIYESVFNHKEFTGRSGSFFKYEGLGSIYWHMISKLLLAVGENIQRFIDDDADALKINQLRSYYTEIREGIGIHKNPKEYGAIPTDPYSHTPSMLGAQQPGMTGQVKEDIISRWFELGIEIKNGEIKISSEHFNHEEVNAKGELSFTFCGTHFRYLRGTTSQIVLKKAEGEDVIINSETIDTYNSSLIFARTGQINSVNIYYLK
ncbi:MAG: hypothetical protein PF450_12915 [Bacteroidales bacterium]|jgi:hypothetical protein|nr:hypothetical protein [Bacteroidales bacterium]